MNMCALTVRISNFLGGWVVGGTNKFRFTKKDLKRGYLQL